MRPVPWTTQTHSHEINTTHHILPGYLATTNQTSLVSEIFHQQGEQAVINPSTVITAFYTLSFFLRTVLLHDTRSADLDVYMTLRSGESFDSVVCVIVR